MIRIITIVLFSFISIISFSQTDYTSQLSAWKSKFPDEEFVAASYKTIINFTLNANPKPGFAKVNVLVRNEITIVPTKISKLLMMVYFITNKFRLIM
jgi:hypothetical protein